MTRYPGGKGLLFRQIINLLPEHDTYIETHLGGGAVLRHKKPAARQNIGIDIDADVVRRWKESCREGYDIRQADAYLFLKSYPFTGDEVVYCDPPYLARTRRGGRLYRYEYTDQDHIDLLRLLRQLPCRVLISGYPDPLYDSLLAGWNTRAFNAKTQAATATEKVWFNYAAPEKLHDSRWLGNDFRERERIRRRLATLQRRVSGLHGVEREAFLAWVREAFPSAFGDVEKGHGK